MEDASRALPAAARCRVARPPARGRICHGLKPSPRPAGVPTPGAVAWQLERQTNKLARDFRPSSSSSGSVVRLLAWIIVRPGRRRDGRPRATWLALTRGTAFGAVAIGAWTAWPKVRHPRRQSLCRGRRSPAAASFPVGSGDGVAFVARTDDDATAARRPLRRADQRHNPAGAVLDAHTVRPAGPPDRPTRSSGQGFTSQEIVRNADGSLDIVVAPRSGPATGCRPTGRQLYAGAAALTTRRLASPPARAREAPMPRWCSHALKALP